MTPTDMALSSLSMDLYRVAQSAHRGSMKTCKRFLQETDRWIDELDEMTLQPSMKQVVGRIKQLKSLPLDQTVAEYALVYSILLKNHVVHNF